MSDKNDFEKWQKQWEEAEKKGIFKKSAESVESPLNTQTSTNSFFGFQDTQPTERVATGDAAYWKKVLAKSDSSFQDQEILLEDDQKIVGDVAKTIAKSPNPIRQHTVGKDQELNVQSLGSTFSEQDIEELTSLKVKLHSLQDQLNTFESRGRNARKFESQIHTLKNKIDELSDAMTRTFPFAISPQGD